MIISIIVAVAENNVIGYDNKLIWHLPADLKFFKSITTGHHIIMGRKTYESIGKPLPNRTTVIVTRNAAFKADGCLVVGSLEEAISRIPAAEKEVFIVGGAEIYKQSIGLAQRIYFTKVHHQFEGDTFFPELNMGTWRLINSEMHQPDEKNKYPYSFMLFEKV